MGPLAECLSSLAPRFGDSKAYKETSISVIGGKIECSFVLYLSKVVWRAFLSVFFWGASGFFPAFVEHFCDNETYPRLRSQIWWRLLYHVCLLLCWALKIRIRKISTATGFLLIAVLDCIEINHHYGWILHLKSFTTKSFFGLLVLQFVRNASSHVQFQHPV